MTDERKGITLLQLKDYIFFGATLVSIVWSYSNLQNTQNNMKDSISDIKQQVSDQGKDVEALKTDVALIKQTLQNAKDKGILSRRIPATNTIALASKTFPVTVQAVKSNEPSAQLNPSPSPQNVTYNNTTVIKPAPQQTKQNSTQATPTPGSTPTLTPTPTQQPIVPELFNGVIRGLI